MIPYTLKMAQDDLWIAGYAIRDLAPQPLQKLIDDAMTADTFDEGHHIERTIIAQALELAAILDDRAICPLCKRESSDPYMHGFAYPEGLRRHLEGRSARQCSVIEAIWNMIRQSVRSYQEHSQND